MLPSREPDAVADGICGAGDVFLAFGEESQKVAAMGLAGVEFVSYS